MFSRNEAGDDKSPYSPREALDTLPPVEFTPEDPKKERGLAQAELLQSVLQVARVDHVVESKMVRDAVKAALGRVPGIDD